MIKLTLLTFASNRDNSSASLNEMIESSLLFCIFTDFIEAGIAIQNSLCGIRENSLFLAWGGGDIPRGGKNF